MTINKFLTIDLATGKKILKNLEANLVKFNLDGLEGKIAAEDLQGALKEEVLRAFKAEEDLKTSIEEAIAEYKSEDQLIKDLIGAIPEKSTVKGELDKLKALIDGLQESKAEKEHTHKIADVTDLQTKLDEKANTNDLLEDGKFKTSLLPSLAINETFIVTSADEAMLKPIQNGDIIIINPDHVETYSVDKPTSGTFICVDITKETFEERFRLLYSHNDAISKAEVEAAIKIETDRAERVEEQITEKVTTNEGEISKIKEEIAKIKAQEELTVVVTAEGIVVGDVLTIKDNGTIAKATTEDDNVFGIATKVEDSTVTVTVMGKVKVSQSLTAGKVYFLNDENGISETCPTEQGKYIIKVGRALSANELLINIEEAISIC